MTACCVQEECLADMTGLHLPLTKQEELGFAHHTPSQLSFGIAFVLNKCIAWINGPPLWSSGQSSWLQIQRSGFRSRRYQIFWEVVGLERGPLSLLSTTEELFERKSSGSGLENQDYASTGLATLTTRHPLYAKVGTCLADKRRSLARYGFARGLRPRRLFSL
jgi:hypothetical protein